MARAVVVKLAAVLLVAHAVPSSAVVLDSVSDSWFHGNWSLKNTAGNLCVGMQEDCSGGDVIWTNSIEDTAHRLCLFNDKVIFSPNNQFENDFGTNADGTADTTTWVEPWQSDVDMEGCGSLIAPFNPVSTTPTWSWNEGTSKMTIDNYGWLGLPKAQSTELTTSHTDVEDTREYGIIAEEWTFTCDDDTLGTRKEMTARIQVGDDLWWNFRYIHVDGPSDSCGGVIGCMDPAATNFDVHATHCDGHCLYGTFGCTIPGAVNYDPNANVNDGSCQCPALPNDMSMMNSIVGTWTVDRLLVGPNQGDGSWWAWTSPGGRPCYADDTYTFDSDGTFTIDMGGETWLEQWQGVDADQCGTPMAPHDGSGTYSWAVSAGDGTLEVDGVGAFIGLPKVYNQGEWNNDDNPYPYDNPPDPSTIVYEVTCMYENQMILDIEVPPGAWWRYQLTRTESSSSVLTGTTWEIIPAGDALCVGPALGSCLWWGNSIEDVTTRACYFDDTYVFNADGSFQNVMGVETWLEAWQEGVDADQCGAPVAPHDGSGSYTWSFANNQITVEGVGAFIGLPKVYNQDEWNNDDNPYPYDNPPDSLIRYDVVCLEASKMTLDIQYGSDQHWTYHLRAVGETSVSFCDNEVISGCTDPNAVNYDEAAGQDDGSCAFNNGDIDLTGTWKVESLRVGPTPDNGEWWSWTSPGGRGCYADDTYTFDSDGSFTIDMGGETWLEAWQGGDVAYGCGTPVYPHDGTGTYSWLFANNTITLSGVGAFVGLPKVIDNGELVDAGDEIPSSRTYAIYGYDNDAGTLTLVQEIPNGFWTTVLERDSGIDLQTFLQDTWHVPHESGALCVGPEAGSCEWWGNSIEDVTTRACYFDDTYVFNADGSFQNVMGTETWLEAWQGGDVADGCGTPVYPHDGTDTYMWSFANDDEITLSGLGAFVGLPKATGDVTNGELPGAPVPMSRTYTVSDFDQVDCPIGTGVAKEMAVDILSVDISSGSNVWWRFKMRAGDCEMGCTNPDATNYDADADVDDGSCSFFGCNDESAQNYNPTVTVNDGSCTYSTSGLSASDLSGPWRLYPGAGAIMVGPQRGSGEYYTNSAELVTGAEYCRYDDIFVFGADGVTFNNTYGSVTWLEEWQYPTGSGYDHCGAPVSPHDGTNAGTFTLGNQDVDRELTITGQGNFLGIGKVINGGEIANAWENVPDSRTYKIYRVSEDKTEMWLDIEINGGKWWRFYLVKAQGRNFFVGDWEIAHAPEALCVGDAQGDCSWWKNSLEDVTTRDCLFDDVYRFSPSGSFYNRMQGSTWIEEWESDGNVAQCDTPLAPHNGLNTDASWSFDACSMNAEGKITLVGVGSFLGLNKVFTNGQFSALNPVSDYNVPLSREYIVSDMSINLHGCRTFVADVEYASSSWWRFNFISQGCVAGCTDVTASNFNPNAQVSDSSNCHYNGCMDESASNYNPNAQTSDGSCHYELSDLDTDFFKGSWVLSPICGAYCVGMGQGNCDWWSSTAGMVNTRWCLFDDEYVFGDDMSFRNVLGKNTYIEDDNLHQCDHPLSPHDGSGNGMWSLSGTDLIISGEGSYVGISKVYDGGELSSVAVAPADGDRTYSVYYANDGELTVDIAVESPGMWRFHLTRVRRHERYHEVHVKVNGLSSNYCTTHRSALRVAVANAFEHVMNALGARFAVTSVYEDESMVCNMKLFVDFSDMTSDIQFADIESNEATVRDQLVNIELPSNAMGSGAITMSVGAWVNDDVSSNDASSSSSSTSSGAIAGIVVGCLAGVVVVAGVAFFASRHFRGGVVTLRKSSAVLPEDRDTVELSTQHDLKLDNEARTDMGIVI